MKKLLVVLAVSLLIGAEVPGEAGRKERQKLQGTWRTVSMETEHGRTPEDYLKYRTVTYTGERWVMWEGQTVLMAGTQTLDPTRTPHEIDSIVTDFQGRKVTMLGIYDLKGDTFKVCFDPLGKERPRDFNPKAAQFTAVFQREKK